jgi:hypothetical protein
MRIAALFTLLAFSSASLAGSTGLGMKDLNDDIRASVIKEMSKMKRYDDGGKRRRNGVGDEETSQNGCNMDIGSTKSPTRANGPTPRRVVTVVTGNVVQLCNQ